MNLPGTIKHLPSTTTHHCDDHDDRLAVVRVQGETDSFGVEYLYMCTECFAEYSADDTPEVTDCDWCKAVDVNVYPTRDYDEGLNGPVYMCCKQCIAKINVDE